MPKDFRNDPQAHVVYKPVIPRTENGKSRRQPAISSSQAGAPKANPFIRAENEDDDGYDPYSDRPAEREPLFERDPWD